LDEGAVRVAVHRLRKRYRQLLRDEIAQNLADSADVDEEMRALFRSVFSVGTGFQPVSNSSFLDGDRQDACPTVNCLAAQKVLTL